MKDDPRYSKVTIPSELLEAHPLFTELGNLAKRRHATGGYDKTNTWYFIEPWALPVKRVQAIVDNGGQVDNYRITRYIAVEDLSLPLPLELPQSAVKDEDEVGRQLTWQEVQDLPTVNVSPVNDVFYFDCTAHCGHRGLTLDELNACAGLPLIETPPTPPTNEE